MDASKTFDTPQDIIDLDVANDTVTAPGSLSRSLRRVQQGLDLVRALFEQFLSNEYASPFIDASDLVFKNLFFIFFSFSFTKPKKIPTWFCVILFCGSLILQKEEIIFWHANSAIHGHYASPLVSLLYHPPFWTIFMM